MRTCRLAGPHYVTTDIQLVGQGYVAGRVIKNDRAGFSALRIAVFVRAVVDIHISNIGIEIHSVIGEVCVALDMNITDIAIRIKPIEVTAGNIGISNRTVCFNGWNRTLFDFRISDRIVCYQLGSSNANECDIADISVNIDGI